MSLRIGLCLAVAFLLVSHACRAAPSPSPYDHRGPEIDPEDAPTVVPGTSPVVHQKYYRGERELFGYNPRFLPTGGVAFDLANRPYLRAGLPQLDAGDGTRDGCVQTLGDDGRWAVWSLPELLRPAYPHWGGKYAVGVNVYNTRIVFDRDGDAYTLVHLLSPGARKVLMHLPHGADAWRIYDIPQPGALRLERADRYSDAARPPLIVSQHGDLIALWDLSKAEDDSIIVPKPAEIASEGYFLNPAHSGSGPVSATVAGQTWIVFAGKEPVKDDNGDPLSGTPQYVASFDHETGAATEPVLIGFGQNCYTEKPDVHNAGAIVADSEGHLHVIMGAHQHHFWYTRSKTTGPQTADDWTEPEPLGLQRRYDCGYTYVALAIDDNDTLHCIGRNMGRGVAADGTVLGPDEINNADMTRTIDYLRAQKQPDGTWQWEEKGPLLVAFHRGYSIFYHKLTLDRLGRLFLTYYYYAAQLTPEMVAAYRAKWPEENLQEPEDGKSYAVRPHDPIILMSDDNGDTWRIALTDDFIGGMARWGRDTRRW